MRRQKKTLIIAGAIIVVTLIGSLFAQHVVQNGVIAERQKNAQAVIDLFHESLNDKFENMNYAAQLSNTLAEGSSDVQMFKEKASKMLQNDENVEYIAYFEVDNLHTILPEEYGELVGNNLGEFSYSYTLAKVVKDVVIEGPEVSTINNENVFLFVYPIVGNNNEYLGEIVVALDSDYVIKQMNLNYLEKGKYDYELWRVNELGNHKTIIATSNKKADFSKALKLDFSLPASWNISIQPREGWLPIDERIGIDIICIGGGLLALFFIGLVYFYTRKMKELKYVGYLDPNCNLLNQEGFIEYTDIKIQKGNYKHINVLYIHLCGYHDISLDLSHEEMIEYFTLINRSIEENFGQNVISARLSEEVIVLTFFKDINDEKTLKAIEDFILQLFLKRKIQGKKMFVEPKSCVVSYPQDGLTAVELLKSLYAKYHQLYEDTDNE